VHLTLQLDWVRYYPVDGSGSATAITAGDTNTATTAVSGTNSSAVTATARRPAA
jgi:hypothetical protein